MTSVKSLIDHLTILQKKHFFFPIYFSYHTVRNILNSWYQIHYTFFFFQFCRIWLSTNFLTWYIHTYFFVVVVLDSLCFDMKMMIWRHQASNWTYVNPIIDGILPKGPYPPSLRMADRALFAGYLHYMVSLGHSEVSVNIALMTHPRTHQLWLDTQQGLYSLRRRRLISIGIPIINLRRSSDRLRFIMGIHIPVRPRILCESRPWCQSCEGCECGFLSSRFCCMLSVYMC